LKNVTSPDSDVIEVTDPAHPLFGRRFTVLSICKSAHGIGSVLVAYRDSIQLRISLPATSLNFAPAALRTKLTKEAIQQIISLVKEDPESCHTRHNPSGNDSRPR
jgi:hypothetical protein